MLVFPSTLQAYLWMGKEEGGYLMLGPFPPMRPFPTGVAEWREVVQGIFPGEFLGTCLLVALPALSLGFRESAGVQ